MASYNPFLPNTEAGVACNSYAPPPGELFDSPADFRDLSVYFLCYRRDNSIPGDYSLILATKWL